MARQTLKRTAKVCFDILIFLLVCFAVYALLKWGKTVRRGFFCGDESISYPFRESTIGLIPLIIISLTVAPIIVLTVELFKHLEPYNINNFASKRKLASTVAPISSSSATNSTYHIGYRLLQCYKHIGYYFFGLGLTLLSTDIIKFTAGRLRPHFFAVCQPKMLDGTTCDDDINQGRYIMEYTCLGQNMTKTTIELVNQSFPSGHSSIIFYSMVYICIYLQASMSTRASKLLKHLLQFVFIMFAAYTALTRVSDYMHHWSDVLSGSILGTIIAIIVTLYMSDLFERRGRFINTTYKTHFHKAMANSSASSTAKSIPGAGAASAALPAYAFGTLPYLHYSPHHAQYSHATYQNYGYVP